MIFNTHTHLNDKRFDENYKEIIEESLAQGIKLAVIGYDLESSKKAIKIAEEFDGVYAVPGLHPSDSSVYSEEYMIEIEALLTNEKVVAVGECGLDFYWDTCSKEVQEKSFEAQILLAKKYNLPLVVHSRDALDATYQQLKKHAPIRGIMHCYSGSAEMAPKFIELGMYISLAGPVTFKNARVPKEVAKLVDLDRLLVETDDPYLTPHPFRGKENRAYYVTHVVDAIAELKEVDSEVVAKKTYQNALDVFGLE